MKKNEVYLPDIRNKRNYIIALEGVNATGKSHVFNYLQTLFFSRGDKIGFLSFPDFYKYKNDPASAAEYVNERIERVWGRYDVLIVDRWLISNLMYTGDFRFLQRINLKYRDHFIPNFTFIFAPSSILGGWVRMVIRNIIKRKWDCVGLIKYWQVKKRYDGFKRVYPVDTIVLQGKDFSENVNSILKHVHTHLSVSNAFEELKY